MQNVEKEFKQTNRVMNGLNITAMGVLFYEYGFLGGLWRIGLYQLVFGVLMWLVGRRAVKRYNEDKPIGRMSRWCVIIMAVIEGQFKRR